jgi:hypothetical protein
MARFLLESNRKFCAIFRRQVQKNCQETAGKLFIQDGVVLISNEKSASVYKSSPGTKKPAIRRLSVKHLQAPADIWGAVKLFVPVAGIRSDAF